MAHPNNLIEFTEDVFNFIRLSSLLDFAKLPLIYLLEIDEHLGSLIQRKRKKLDVLVKQNHIYKDENDILKGIEGPAEPEKLDVRLLCVLVKNISNVPSPRNGWSKKKLEADDKSIGADVIRIGDIRNDCHHLPSSTKITREKFNAIYPKLKEIVERMVQGTPNEEVYQSLVTGLDAPDFASSQCARRLSMDRVIEIWKLNTRQNSVEPASECEAQNTDGSDTFLKAVIANDIQSIKALINAQSKEIVREGIRNAILGGNNEIFEILAAKYRELGVDHRDLARACRNGSKEIVEIILEQLDTRSLANHTEGESILKRCCIHHAASGGYHDTVERLYRKQEDMLKAVDKANNTALHFASMRRHTGVITTILKSGNFGKSQISDLNGKGLTPLHCAAYFGKLSAVELLVSWGANKCSKDLRGRSVLDWCNMGQEQSSQFSWYDSEFDLLPATYGSQEDYTKIMEILHGD